MYLLTVTCSRSAFLAHSNSPFFVHVHPARVTTFLSNNLNNNPLLWDVNSVQSSCKLTVLAQPRILVDRSDSPPQPPQLVFVHRESP